jgi:hypothetical protein
MNIDSLLFLIILILLGFAGSFIITSYLDTGSNKFSDYIKETCNNNGIQCDTNTHVQSKSLSQPTTIPPLISTSLTTASHPDTISLNTLNQTIPYES